MACMFKTGLSTMIAFLLIATILLAMTGCGGGSSALIGKWIEEDDESSYLEILKSGTLLYGYSEVITGRSGKWRVDEGHLIIAMVGGGGQDIEISYTYEISGSTLTVTGEGPARGTYKKTN